MFKRTHASCRAFDDGEFVAWKLGMVVSVNVTYYCNAGTQFMTLKPCAERVVATVLANFEFHYYQGHVTPQKEITTCDFADGFVAANDFSDPTFAWSEWTAQGSSHYVPTLDTHLKLWGSSGVGHVVELVTGNVSSANAGTFAAYGAGECGGANELATTIAEMDDAWTAQGGTLVNLFGLPDLLPLRITQPSTDAAAIPEFLEAHSDQHLGASTFSHETDAESCTWTRSLLNIDATLAGWAMEVVSIHNRRAAKRGYNVSFFASYVTEAQDELIACNTGYARYVDNHIGVSLGGPDSLSLDANAESLCRNDGNFDWTFFHPELVDPLDYCAKLGSGDSMDFCPYNMTAIKASSPATWWEENWMLVAVLAAVAVFCCCAAGVLAYCCGWCACCGGDAAAAGYAVMQGAQGRPCPQRAGRLSTSPLRRWLRTPGASQTVARNAFDEPR
ncbi:hypothetical protein JL721_6289 [Aureococcus anophagefferens]|nr:hypothetical protein JL721_6289 [Aureococcus anophagefferens]